MTTLASTVLAIGALATAAGCASDVDTDGYPLNPGGGSPPPGQSDNDLRKRVCVVDVFEAVSPGECGDASGVSITVGDQTVTADADGRFELERPTGDDPTQLTYRVDGDGVIATVSPFATGSSLVPVVDADRYAATLSSIGLELPADRGAIIGRLGTSALPGVGATVTTPGGDAAFYDGIGELDATGARGVFFVPGLTAGRTDLSIGGLPGGSTTVNGISVINGGITILDSVALP